MLDALIFEVLITFAGHKEIKESDQSTAGREIPGS
jgi:hypothetical protein